MDRRVALGYLALGALAWLVPAVGQWVASKATSDAEQHPVELADGWRGLLQGRPLDLEAATYEDLVALPGVGPSTTRAILDDRRTYGPFLRVDELIRVPGIGPKTLERLRPYLRTGVRAP